MQKKKINLDSNLKYRNQFIITPEPVSCFPGWQHSYFIGDKVFIYAHPSLSLETISNKKENIKIVLLGYIVHPDFPKKSNIELLTDLVAKTNSLSDFTKNIIDFAGRYVFIISIDSNIYIMSDAGGLRSVFYTVHAGEKYVATQPLIFNEILPLETSANNELYFNSRHYKEDLEYWVPSGVTLYDNINHLIPNHYLDISSLEQVRFWPIKNLKKYNYESGSEKAADYLKKLLYAVSLRFNLTLPLTAGVDSRILMAASKSFNHNLFYYTLLYSRHDKTSYDINIPKHILKKFKRKHHIINCQLESNPAFLEFYKKNVDLAHEDWAKNLYGMFNEFPIGSVDLKGNVSEIARCVLYPDGKHPKITSLSQINMYLSEFDQMPFIMNKLEEWFKDAITVSNNTGYEILDLFYWEIRTGSWYAQANNEMDILTETFTPFNYRPLLETMLGVPAVYRQREASQMHKKIITLLWPELLYWPVNKRWNNRDKLKYYMADKFKKYGGYKSAKMAYQLIHQYYLNIKAVFI
jgi:hypothetical protein